MTDDAHSLLAHQRASFAAFAQADTAPELRRFEGLEARLHDTFPIRSFDELMELDYGGYRLSDPIAEPHACLLAGATYARELWVTLRSVRFQHHPAHGRMVLDLVEEDVSLGALPWMTDAGTFVVDGVERVVHPQLAREPGVWFRVDGREHTARIEPLVGPRIEYRVARKRRVLQARVGPRGKWIPATALPRALGLDREQLLGRAYGTETLLVGERDVRLRFDPARLLGRRATRDVVHNGTVLVRRSRRFTRAMVRAMVAAGVTALELDECDVEGLYAARDVVDAATGAVIFAAGESLTMGHLPRLRRAGVREVPVLIAAPWIFNSVYSDLLRDADAMVRDTEMRSGIASVEDAQRVACMSLPGHDEVDPLHAGDIVRRTLCDPARFDLTPAGRARMNRILGTEGDHRALTADDLVATLKALVRRATRWEVDRDEPQLGDAVVRGVGELLDGVLRQALERVAMGAREMLSLGPPDYPPSPTMVIRVSPVERALREFFTRSRVSAAATRANPAATVAQSRWLASVEPEANSSKRSGFVLEDTAWSQYGLLCPIEAKRERGPVGSALALGARVGPLGRLERLATPAIENEPARYVDALTLATAPTELDGALEGPLVAALTTDGVRLGDPSAIAWRDLSRERWVGAAAALVPFGTHDAPACWIDGARNLCDALPPLRAKPPRVATTLDAPVALASCASVRARVAGVVARVDGRAVVVRHDDGEETHRLRSFEASQGALLRERPCVREGDAVAMGDLLAEGHGVVAKTLACGDDALVALMAWAGYTDNGAVVVSERLVREGRLTTAHVHTVTSTVGRAHNGRRALDPHADDLTDEERARLDDAGLARVGATVREGDALAGRTHTDLYGRATHGASLRAPRGCEGVVIRAETYRPDKRAQGTEVIRVWVAQQRPLSVGDLVGSRHGDRGAIARVVPEEDLPMLSDGRAVEAVINPAAVVERGAVGMLCEMIAAGGARPIEAPITVPFSDHLLAHDEGVTLRDGRTGETFAAKVAVGPLHLFKLTPMACDVFEARSRGPRDAATRMPVADASHAPGQSLDEDAVWALVAHGAAHTLRETLGARGDDANAAAALDRSLARGDDAPVEAASQAFATFLRTLQAAAIDVSIPRRKRR